MGKIPEKEVFMRKVIFFLIGIILAGTLAYFTAYEIYTSENHKADIPESVTLQRAAPKIKNNQPLSVQEYYLARIEEEMLVIYQMPEEQVYDSVKLSSLYFTMQDQKELSKGIIFQDLRQLFEFLENSMS